MGETRLEHSSPTHRRVRVTVNPLPRRPPPVSDELLSSWIGRLARANHCSVEELCGYLGLGQGRVPEHINDLGQVDWARLCSAVQLTRHEIAAMTLPDTTHLGVQYVSSDDFQSCASCAGQTPGLILRHWRFAWSLTCENCGRPLVARRPTDGIADRISVRATRGAATMKAAVQANDLQRIRRFSLTLSVLKVLDLAYAAPLTSRSQMERFTALAAVDVCDTRPLLGAAILLHGNDKALRELRRVFPQHRGLIDRVHRLSLELDGRLPRKPLHQCIPVSQPDKVMSRPSRKMVSSEALNAARQAVSELGSDADRQALLVRADAIWKRQSCVRR
ncbi:TniQ family protein [Sulfitobacter litoralis]|uniref:TniQ family protein n=1 Tax=Sulfitobacter litoralis TaxID=335975 RepID=UPI003AB926CF